VTFTPRWTQISGLVRGGPEQRSDSLAELPGPVATPAKKQ
jgi:hypothetical protein